MESPSAAKSLEPEIDDPARQKSDDSGPQPGRATTEITVRSFEFSGPLPPPQLLTAYNDAFPGCAERIVAMAEKQAEHRQQLEKSVVQNNCRAQSFGQIFAFILSLIVLGGGVYVLAQGKSIAGFSAIILALGSLIGALYVSRIGQQRERSEKLRPLPSSPGTRSRKSKKKKPK